VAYCHVPNGSTVDMTERMEAQIERFAPGFGDLVLARTVRTADQAEAHNPNLLGATSTAGRPRCARRSSARWPAGTRTGRRSRVCISARLDASGGASTGCAVSPRPRWCCGSASARATARGDGEGDGDGGGGLPSALAQASGRLVPTGELDAAGRGDRLEQATVVGHHEERPP